MVRRRSQRSTSMPAAGPRKEAGPAAPTTSPRLRRDPGGQGCRPGTAGAWGVRGAELWGGEGAGAGPPRPASLAAFMAGPRFRREMRRLAGESGRQVPEVAGEVAAAMAAMARLPGRFDELDWHR